MLFILQQPLVAQPPDPAYHLSHSNDQAVGRRASAHTTSRPLRKHDVDHVEQQPERRLRVV